MKRRKFVVAGGVSIAGLSFLPFSIRKDSLSEVKAPLLPDFLPEEIILSIGKEYVKANPDFEQELDGLLSRKLSGDQIKEDFAEENTLVVSGWVLSRTEARYCALIYLHNQ